MTKKTDKPSGNSVLRGVFFGIVLTLLAILGGGWLYVEKVQPILTLEPGQPINMEPIPQPAPSPAPLPLPAVSNSAAVPADIAALQARYQQLVETLLPLGEAFRLESGRVDMMMDIMEDLSATTATTQEQLGQLQQLALKQQTPIFQHFPALQVFQVWLRLRLREPAQQRRSNSRQWPALVRPPIFR